MTTVRKQYRIILPLSLEEYHISQLFIVTELSKSESTGDTSIEIVENVDYVHETYGNCRKTVKKLNLNSKVPAVLRKCLPKAALSLEEIAYNAFPKCNTTYYNSFFNKNKVYITVDSLHVEGTEVHENIFNVDEDIWKKTKVQNLDISRNIVKKEYNPSTFLSSKTGRGPLVGDWINDCKDKNIPLMTCYKNVTIVFDYFGLGWLSSEIDKQMETIFLSAHQQLFCMIDSWYGLTMNDIRNIESKTADELNKRSIQVEE